MNRFTGSIEEKAATLQEMEQTDFDQRAEAQAEEYERVEVQRLYDQKHGICDFCRKKIEQPAYADTQVIHRAGQDIRILIHASEWLKASLSGWKLAPEFGGSQA